MVGYSNNKGGRVVVTPLGFASKMMDHMQSHIAATVRFQAWTGTMNEAAAKARTTRFGLDTPPTFPTALVGAVEDGAFSRKSDAVGGGVAGESILNVEFIAQRDTAKTVEDDFTTFENNVGLIVQEMETLVGQGGRLSIKETVLDGVFEMHPADASDVARLISQLAVFTIAGF